MWVNGSRSEPVSVALVPDASGKADVLVVFGITGDLARVMTFRSLYRLEARGLLDARVFERLPTRFSYVSGDFDADATYGRAKAAIGGASSPVFYLEIPPFL